MASLTCKTSFLWLHTLETLGIQCSCFQGLDPLSSFTYSTISLDYFTYVHQTHSSITKDINDLNMINELDLIDRYRLWHPIQFQNTYSFHVHMEH